MSKQIYTLSCEDAVEFLSEAAWGFAEVDPSGTFVWLNASYLNILNAPADLVLGTNVTKWTYPEDVAIYTDQAAKVATGEISYYTLAMRYIQRGSTKQNPRITWGMLSAQGKYSPTGEFLGYRVQFRPYEDPPRAADYTAKAKAILDWGIANWKTILTVVAVSSTLVFGGSDTLLDLLQKARSIAESVEQALPSSSSGALPPASSR